jgi:hypothetical protein
MGRGAPGAGASTGTTILTVHAPQARGYAPLDPRKGKGGQLLLDSPHIGFPRGGEPMAAGGKSGAPSC